MIIASQAMSLMYVFQHVIRTWIVLLRQAVVQKAGSSNRSNKLGLDDVANISRILVCVSTSKTFCKNGGVLSVDLPVKSERCTSMRDAGWLVSLSRVIVSQAVDR